MNILNVLYPKDLIFIKSKIFNKDKLSIETACLVPSENNYSKIPVPYVTEENYDRCLSQTAYIFAYNLIKEDALLPYKITESDFIKAMVNLNFYYRSSNKTLHKRVKKGEEFKIHLKLKEVVSNKIFRKFQLITFIIERTVVSGKISFVYVK